MSIKVRIPSPLQNITGGKPEVEADGNSIVSLIDNLDSKFSGFRQRVYDENGKLRRFLNIYVNEKDIRFLDGEKTALKDGDEVSIIPAIAGGGFTL